MSPAVLHQAHTAAREASDNAYAPYSRFSVGAAAITASGEVFAACNVENASLGLSICAERSAVFQMVAAGHRALAAIVIYTPTPKPTAPCGACRQVLSEFGPNCTVISFCDGPEEQETQLSALLPNSFGPDSL